MKVIKLKFLYGYKISQNKNVHKIIKINKQHFRNYLVIFTNKNQNLRDKNRIFPILYHRKILYFAEIFYIPEMPS